MSADQTFKAFVASRWPSGAADRPTESLVCHLVKLVDHKSNTEIALCGMRLLVVGHGGADTDILPEGHDFVFLPDPKCVASCAKCLEEQAKDQSVSQVADLERTA
jgi:hypothetical protein